MILIDGVRYDEWMPTTEDEFEQIVNEHAQEIFGEDTIYFDKKQRLKSASGIVSIPDGYVIAVGNSPSWRIVEVELSSHPPYEHIVPQTDKFVNAVDYQNTRNDIVESLYGAINNDELLKIRVRQAIGRDKDIHKFLADLISQPPIITIVIEKETEQVKEVLKKYAQKKVIEFQTFIREGVGISVHAHLFEPLYMATSLESRGAILNSIIKDGTAKRESTKTEAGETRRKVVVSPTGERLSRTKFVERFASESERKASITNERYPYVMVDTQAKFDAFIAKHPECAGWKLQ